MLPELITEVPGPRSRALAKKLQAFESQNVTYISPEFPIFWERAKDSNIWDVDGNRYLDLTSGFGVATMGWGAEVLVGRIREQANVLYHAMGDVYPCAGKAELCELLSQVTFERWGCGQAKVVLGNSGFESVEAAMKTAFLATGKKGVIAFEGGYHGLGYGAMTVTGCHEFYKPFQKQLADIVSFVPFPHALEVTGDWEASLRDQLVAFLDKGHYGAILVEPVQGRGGEVVPPDGFLKLLRQVADDYGVVLIFDEIYTGFYRTGSFFACEVEGVYPDVICLGKAMSGGFPISACVGKSSLMDHWPKSQGEALHTSTFLGHPLGCEMSVESLKFWRQKEVGITVKKQAELWREFLEPLFDGFVCIKHMRGRGLMWGLEFVGTDGEPDAGAVSFLVREGLRRGVILLAGGVQGNIISFTPNLALENEELTWTISMIKDLLEQKS